jgi:hypothetical protein
MVNVDETVEHHEMANQKVGEYTHGSDDLNRGIAQLDCLYQQLFITP